MQSMEMDKRKIETTQNLFTLFHPQFPSSRSRPGWLPLVVVWNLVFQLPCQSQSKLNDRSMD
jgi:hypothetical protein